PATRHETSGAVLNADDLKPYYANKQTRGLGEVMDLDAVKGTSDDMMHKLADVWNSGKTVDGHGAGLLPGDNNIYRTAGISTDHECTTREEALDRLRKGFYIHIREGSVARNFDELIPLVNRSNHRRFTFCTDDIYINELFEDGSIDQMIRRAVGYGIDPVDAIRMATLNPSECYGLKTKGAVAPGYEADLVILSSLENFDIQSVYQKGKLIWDQGKIHYDFQQSESPALDNTIKIRDFGAKDLKIVSETGKLNVIEAIPNSLLTNHITIDYEKNRNFEADEAHDLAKLLVIERHGNHGNMGKGIVKGFHMKKGAVATTIAHDSHNLVALGVNDQDILLAINRIKEIGGGIVITQNGKIMAELKLDIAGLMSSSTIEEISSALKNLKNASRQIFHEIDFNPFLTLSFLTLPVIPELKITDQGLYNTKTARFIGIDEILS
ncbi:MAG TPA: adenine deaminase C-terminal domain-containing protein, partial [Bacteroidales bacterium]|nr:adenine deaminase C-terminal domain-containing protein [Bacteroidales bacterium]